MASLLAAPPTPPFTIPSTPPRSVPVGPRGTRHVDVFAMARVQNASARLQGVIGSHSWRSPGPFPDSPPDSTPLSHLMPPADLEPSPFRAPGNKRVCSAARDKAVVAAAPPGDVRAIPRGGPTLQEALAGSSPPQTPTKKRPIASQPGDLAPHKMAKSLYQLQVRRNDDDAPSKPNPRACTVADDRALTYAVLTNLAQNTSSPAWTRVARILGSPWDADAARRRFSDIVDGGAIAVSRSIDQRGPAEGSCGPVPAATYNDDPLLVSAVVSQAAKATSAGGWNQVSALLGCRRDAVGARDRFARLVAEGVIYLSRSVEPKS